MMKIICVKKLWVKFGKSLESKVICAKVEKKNKLDSLKMKWENIVKTALKRLDCKAKLKSEKNCKVSKVSPCQVSEDSALNL